MHTTQSRSVLSREAETLPTVHRKATKGEESPATHTLGQLAKQAKAVEARSPHAGEPGGAAQSAPAPTST